MGREMRRVCEGRTSSEGKRERKRVWEGRRESYKGWKEYGKEKMEPVWEGRRAFMRRKRNCVYGKEEVRLETKEDIACMGRKCERLDKKDESA